MRIGKFLAFGLLAVVVLWGTIIFKVMDTEDFFKNHLGNSTIIKAESNHYLGETEAGKIMESKITGANLFSIELCSDGTRAIYKGGLQKGNTEYNVVLDAKTGDIISIDSKEITSELATENVKENDENGDKSVSTQQTSNNKSTSSKSSSNKNTKTVKTTKTTSTSSKQASTSSKKSTSSNYISRSKATQIMLNRAPGARLISLKRDGSEYEGKLRRGNVKYEITVSAKTGKVLDFDKDYIDYDYDDDDDDDDDD